MVDMKATTSRRYQPQKKVLPVVAANFNDEGDLRRNYEIERVRRIRPIAIWGCLALAFTVALALMINFEAVSRVEQITFALVSFLLTATSIFLSRTGLGEPHVERIACAVVTLTLLALTAIATPTTLREKRQQYDECLSNSSALECDRFRLLTIEKSLELLMTWAQVCRIVTFSAVVALGPRFRYTVVMLLPGLVQSVQTLIIWNKLDVDLPTMLFGAFIWILPVFVTCLITAYKTEAVTFENFGLLQTQKRELRSKMLALGRTREESAKKDAEGTHLRRQLQAAQELTMKVMGEQDSVLRAYQIEYDDIEFKSLLGDGTFSAVYAAHYRGLTVAVKVMRESSKGGREQSMGTPKFRDELASVSF